MPDPIYFDYNATVPVRPAVIESMTAAMGAVGNASSVHGFGRAARRVVEDARDAVARLVGAAPDQVVFTSGGTEANNQALTRCCRARAVLAAIEHDSVLAARPDATLAPVGSTGVLDFEAFEALLARDSSPTVVAVMAANNETGVIQPVAEAAGIAHAHGAVLHCDAIQAAGKIAVDFAALGADYLSLSAHKLGGPQGIGALVLAQGAALEPLIAGGGQERGLRAGTENVAAIAGFGTAAEIALAELEIFAGLAPWRDGAEKRMTAIAPSARIIGEGAPRLPNTSCLTMPGGASETLVMALDLAGIAISAGSACSAGKVMRSHVLEAMGLSQAEAGSAIRVSLGWRTEAGDIDRLVEAWSDIHERFGASAGAVA